MISFTSIKLTTIRSTSSGKEWIVLGPRMGCSNTGVRISVAAGTDGETGRLNIARPACRKRAVMARLWYTPGSVVVRSRVV